MPAASDPTKAAIELWLAAVGAVVTAVLLGYIAHYDLGLTRQEIRTPAVVGAVVIGLLIATEYFGKKLRKPR